MLHRQCVAPIIEGGAIHKTPREQMVATSVTFSMRGVNKARALHRAGESRSADLQRLGGNGAWDIETDGKEDALFSPFLRKPFRKAVEAGLLPPNLATLAGTWGPVSDQGDLTYLNVVHLPDCEGTNPDDLTRGEIEGRRQAVLAVAALKRFMPGCEDAKLRNFGMTLGIRDTRKIDAAYGLINVLQSLGLAVCNLAVGWLNDTSHAGPHNPAGYHPWARDSGPHGHGLNVAIRSRKAH